MAAGDSGGEKDSREGRARAAKPGGCRRGRGGGREEREMGIGEIGMGLGW